MVSVFAWRMNCDMSVVISHNNSTKIISLIALSRTQSCNSSQAGQDSLTH